MSRARIEAIRAKFDAHNIDGYLIPRADMFAGEYVRAGDERLAWISGFDGSAGFALITRDRAMLFVDSRYRLAAAKQSPDFEVIHWPEKDIRDEFSGQIGVDPWLIAPSRFNALNAKAVPNLVDAIWSDRPDYSPISVTPLPLELAGQTAEDKRDVLQNGWLVENACAAFISNNPESAAWLLNIRGGEIPTVPAPHVITVLTRGGIVIYGMDRPNFDLPAKFRRLEALASDLKAIEGSIAYDPTKLPQAIFEMIASPQPMDDPILAAKARKNAAEIRAASDAHAIDGRAVIKFLHWLDTTDHLVINEIKAANVLADLRAQSPKYITPSFETISGFGANGAIVHYRVNADTNIEFDNGIYLVDSGGQYPGATTDITRTVQIGAGDPTAKTPFTEVLMGLAHISAAKFPKGYSGRDIDALARAPLWASGRDYGHGTGHGVGAGLSVHEGPQSISRRGIVSLSDGMIVSLEPGFYAAGAYGIRLENLALVREGDDGFMSFETLSFVPIDTRLIDHDRIDQATRNWLNAYHAECFARHAETLDEATKSWLAQATRPIT